MNTRTNTKSRSGARVLRGLADLLRLAVLAAIVTAIALDEIEGSIRLSVVLLILLAPRLAAIPPLFDLAVCVLLPLAAVASLAHLYRQLVWLDWVMHCLTTGAVAAMVFLVLLRTPLLPPLHAQPRGMVVLLTTTLGVTVGVVWEFYEWFAEVVAGVRIGVGYDDTIADLAMDLLGSLLAGLAVRAWQGRGNRKIVVRF